MIKKLCSVLLVMCLLITGCSESADVENTQEDIDNSANVAATTPYGKYPERITYTLGKMTGYDDSNMPSGDTYEDNAYTRYLAEKLNIQNVDVFEAEEEGSYDETLSMAIASRNLPDVMVVTSYDTLQMLVENDLVEDLSDAYENCASDRIKNIYSSYGDSILEDVTFDGKLMALPGTNIENGPSLLWLRKDWMDKLGLSAPKDMDDVCNIINEFVTKDPGGNGDGKTVGLACSDELTGECGYSDKYQTDIIFASYGAYPKQWIKNSKGRVVYGSVQPEAKLALAKLAQMYKKGLIDENFLIRGDNNIINLIVNGECGSFFGPWSSANSPLMSAVEADSDAEWMPYLIQTDEDGSTSYATQNPTRYYVVVRKGYEHPEIVVKMSSILFDNFRYGREEISDYYQENVDGTARPLAINIDYKNSLMRVYHALRDTLDGVAYNMDLELMEGAYYKNCWRYKNGLSIQHGVDMTSQDWAAYTSRITASSIIASGDIKKVKSQFFGETSFMQEYWWKLQESEKDTYLAIVTGEKPISYFDEFVNDWYSQGGGIITAEVRNSVKDSQKKKKTISEVDK